MKKVLLVMSVVGCWAFNVSAQQENVLMNSGQASVQSSSVKTNIGWTPKYKGEINVGYAITGKRTRWAYESSDSDGEYEYLNPGRKQTILSRPLIETIHGLEIGPYFFVGAGLGVQYYCGKLKEFKYLAGTAAEINQTGKAADRWNAIMLPIFADIKFMYPVKYGFIPFINLGIGGTVGCYSSLNCKEIYENEEDILRARGGFYCDFGAGFRYKVLNFSLGLQHQVFAIESKYIENYNGYYSSETRLFTQINSFYVKVGVNF